MHSVDQLSQTSANTLLTLKIKMFVIVTGKSSVIKIRSIDIGCAINAKKNFQGEIILFKFN